MKEQLSEKTWQKIQKLRRILSQPHNYATKETYLAHIRQTVDELEKQLAITRRKI